VHTAARTKEGGLDLGRNDGGEAGQGADLTEVRVPSPLSFPEKIVKVLCGGYHTLFLDDPQE
jgi:hypothetical protein